MEFARKHAAPPTAFASRGTEHAVDGAEVLAALVGTVQCNGCSASAARVPRQMMSDWKWERDAYITPEQLASVVNKRPRNHNKTAAAVLPLRDRDTAAATITDRPPQPPDPVDAVDSDPENDDDTRDKDRIPSKQTFTWDELSKTWQLIDRPVVLRHGAFYAYVPIPAKQEAVLTWMLAHRSVVDLDDTFLRTQLVTRLNRKHPVSLRLLDWLVVDYAREYNVRYATNLPPHGERVIVVMHALYTAWLNRWRRRLYDPFRRRHRLYFDLDGRTHSTTVGQLHFFFMAQMYGFLDYATAHLAEIDAHMKLRLTETATAKAAAKQRGEKYRRQALVSRAQPTAFMTQGAHTLHFALDDDDEAPPAPDPEANKTIAALFPADC